MEKIAKCILETSNWSKLEPEHKFDNAKFSKVKFLDDISTSAPKLSALLDKIKELDSHDLNTHGKLFKHFIYSDIKSTYGAKLIASALAASGFMHAYELRKTNRGMSFVIKENLKNAFATLTSVSFFEKAIGINFRKELLGIFNSRPDNVYGDKIRIIILDSGFREGVDLFDIKYVHLFEPIITRADEKQAIGRATRFCGQKGLPFDKKAGWPIHVFKYETEIPKRIQHALLSDNRSLAPCDTFFNLFMKFSNLDPKKINFANDIEPLIILAAVDRYLNRNIHNFSISRDDDMKFDIFDGGAKLTKFQQMQKLIRKNYLQYSWPPTKIENGCITPPSTSLKTKEPIIAEFSPTQNFIRNFFTVQSPYKGMLLMHSVGTGKTCSAIAVASSSFEENQYTIIYVTRHTLKGDVWKNMFGLTCNVMIQDMIKQGMSIPEAESKRRKLISAWMEPMSYKQFSNMLAGKSRLYDELIKRNGKKDPLKKTLVIIDEAHKLYAPDVIGSEKPNVELIRTALHNSYQKSGQDSARLLLMTATPYTDDPLDMIKLLNLCKESNDLLPEDFDVFQKVYLDENTGKFTETGKWRFVDDVTGYISYLNRERDVRSFSYPVIENVTVPMSEYEFDSELKDVISTRAEWKNLEEITRDQKSDMLRGKSDYRLKLEAVMEKKRTELLKYTKCVENTHEDRIKAQENYADMKGECNTLVKKCEQQVTAKLKEDTAELRALAKSKNSKCKRGDKECREAIKLELKDKLTTLKEDAKFDKKLCKQSLDKVTCLKEAKTTYEDTIKQLDNKCSDLKKRMQEEKTRIDEEITKKVNEYAQQIFAKVHDYEKSASEKKALFEIKKTELLEKIKKDRSQRNRLETCLKPVKVKPQWDNMLKGKFFSYMEDNEFEEEDIGTANDADFLNVYMINGHGFEKVETFEKRFTLPKDKILVAFPVCGRPNYLDKICNFADIFQTPEKNKILLNPLVYKAELENMLEVPIRIYLPGDKVPNMSTNLFMNFNMKKTVIMKSGVFKLNKIPAIDRTVLHGTNDMRFSLGSEKCFKYTGVLDDPSYYTSSIHREVYKGNVYQPGGVKMPYNQLEKRFVTIKEIMDTVGPGIYYFTGCRSSFEDIPVKTYEKILENSAKQQEQKDRHVAIRGFHKDYIKGSTDDNFHPDEEFVKINQENNVPKPKEDPLAVQKPKPRITFKRPKVSIPQIKRDLKAMMSTFLDDKKAMLRQIKEWSDIVGETNDSNLLQTLRDFKDILNDSDNVQKSVTLNQSKKKDLTYIYRSVKCLVGENKYVVNKQLVGILPVNGVDMEVKCDTSTIVKKLRSLVKKGKSIESVNWIPINEDEWNNSIDKQTLFKEVCLRSKKI